ncbi:MAG: adenylyl-sulfate kinase [Candidatus Nanoarchaeia archaeon]|nr:adenylyl-sulfate kinase [Candidatus Nanoarchaeia archaeon]
MEKENLNFVVVGHVDHGKSTLIGRLLYETNSVTEGKINNIKQICEAKGKPFEYAFLLDALQEEQEQGLTIDTTKIEFSTPKRNYTIIDAPGHKEFLKNMISGAANAEAAVLIIGAAEGIKDDTKKHAYLISLMGIKQLYVLINKMDLINFSEQKFLELKSEMDSYFEKINIIPKAYIPVASKPGDNLTKKSPNMPWYKGNTFLEAIDNFEKKEELKNKPLRIPIQDVYKFDDRRIIAGKVESGSIKVEDEIIILPSNKKSKVKTIESWLGKDKLNELSAGLSLGITIEDDLFLKRGEVISKLENKPIVNNLIKCSIFWMGKEDLITNKKYILKIGTHETEFEIYTVNEVIDASTLEKSSYKKSLSRNEIGNLVIKTRDPIVFDSFEEIPTTGRFVIIDNLDVCGGGIIEKPSRILEQREKVETTSQNISPKDSLINIDERKEKYGHNGKVIWITGLPGSGKDKIAKHLERELFNQNKKVYYINAGTMRLSLNSDLDFSEKSRHEHIRRLSEVANLFYNAGFIVIISVVSPFKEDREYARRIIGEDNFMEIFVDTPLEICKKHNPHGIYTRAEAGEIKNVPGINFNYEKSEYLIHTLNLEKEDYDVNKKIKELAKLIEKDG